MTYFPIAFKTNKLYFHVFRKYTIINLVVRGHGKCNLLLNGYKTLKMVKNMSYVGKEREKMRSRLKCQY